MEASEPPARVILFLTPIYEYELWVHAIIESSVANDSGTTSLFIRSPV